MVLGRELGEPASFVQDTTQQDTTRVRKVEPREERGPARRGAEADTLQADSLGVPQDPFPNPDSIMQELLERPGFRPVVYRGDTLRFSTQDRSIHIRQRANIDRAGDNLQSDSVVYKDEYIIGFGNSTLINAEGSEVTSEEGPLYYNTERKIGTVMGARTEWEVWHVAGNFTLEGSDTLWVRDGHFTSCDLPEPHYRFESDKIKLVLGHIVVAWPVRVYMGDVPVFWFPFMAQDIRRGRHSGILTLRFGFNDIVRNSSGYSRHISNVGYYWAINEYMDAQFSMDWWSDNWTRFDTFFRYRWREKFVDGRIGYSHFFLPEGGREISAAWNHNQKFGERADLRASVQYVSSRQFEREAEFNPERLTQQIRSNVGFTRRFDWGALNLSGQRIQPLSLGQPTTTTVPQLSLTLSPIAITPASNPLEARWYNGLTWTGSTNFTRTLVQTPADIRPDSFPILSDSFEFFTDTTFIPNRTTTNAGVTSDFALNKLRWNSAANFNGNSVGTPDSVYWPPGVGEGGAIPVTGPEIDETTVSWRSSLGYQQRLVGTTSITPALSLDGQLYRSFQTFQQFVSAPTRVSASATLNAEVYGFFPGLGPYERIRHKFTPSFNWLFSPEVEPNPELEGLPIGVGASAERHQLSMGLSQTFEAKLKPRSNLDEGEEEDSAQAQQPAEARKITLLAIRTTALTYDFVTGRLTTGSISNTMTSDLLRGLTVRVQHELFDQRPSGRAFDPFMTQLNLSFSLGEATFAGLFGTGGGGIGRTPGIIPETESMDALEREELMRAEEEARREEEERGDEGGADTRRPWTLSIDYSLLKVRPRPDVDTRPNQQSVRLNLGFSPTQHWTMTWRTQYDIENGDFVDHALTFRRDLHRWAATFGFLKSSNGNFLFNFEVSLNDLSDVRIPYRQETR
jgi:hypothetical protein